MAKGLYGVKSFLGNFIGKLPGGFEREGFLELEDIASLYDPVWKSNPYVTPLLRSQSPKQFYDVIDRTMMYLDISHQDIERARLALDEGKVFDVKRIVRPLIKQLHRMGYSGKDLAN